MTDSPGGVAPTTSIDYAAVEDSPRFRELKRTQRSFIFPLAAFFLVWYFLYVVLAGFFVVTILLVTANTMSSR